MLGVSDKTFSVGYDLVDDLVDLGFDPHERRDVAGRWTDGGIHALKAPSIKKAVSNPKSISLDTGDGGRDYTLDEAVSVVGDAYDWPTMDKESGGDKVSLTEQHKAQIIAKKWASENPWVEDVQFWRDYQGVKEYVPIQRNLRHTKARTDLVKADNMFREGGWTTEHPMTVFHAIKSEKEDWSTKLKPGMVFTDKGMISTTANEKFAYGWLLGDAHGEDVRTPTAKDVVIEVALPVGTRIVGGDPQFIETMLHPDMRFRVISATTKTSNAVDPLDRQHQKVTYTHVVAEVILDGA